MGVPSTPAPFGNSHRLQRGRVLSSELQRGRVLSRGLQGGRVLSKGLQESGVVPSTPWAEPSKVHPVTGAVVCQNLPAEPPSTSSVSSIVVTQGCEGSRAGTACRAQHLQGSWTMVAVVFGRACVNSLLWQLACRHPASVQGDPALFALATQCIRTESRPSKMNQRLGI